jgi:two-component system sensor histidine kinase PilS (NtrC family)
VRWLLFGRLAVGLFIIAYVLVSTRGWGREWSDKIVYAVVTGTLALNAVYLLILRKIGNRSGFVRLQIGLDIAVEAVLVSLTGGVSSQIVVLFMMSIMSASLALSWRAAMAFAAEAAALHVAAALFSFVSAKLPSPHLAGVGELLSALSLQLLGFFAVAMLSGLLAHRLSVARLLSRDILEAIGQGLIVADSEGRVLFANDEAHRLLGEGATSPGDSLETALPGEALDVFAKDAALGRTIVHKVELAGPDGSTVPASIDLRPVLAEDGRQVGTLVIVTDRMLERRVEEAMMQAQRSEALSEMSTAIAHEIRNPLAAMRASVQEIARRLGAQPGGASAESRPLFDIVLSESDRLDAIISDFLAFAKMRPARIGDCDVRLVVEDVALVLRQSAGTGDPVDIVAELDGEPRCRADPQQLRQVLLNLGLNGIEAVSGRPGARVVLRARPCTLLDFSIDRGGAHTAAAVGERAGVQIDVEDNGCGMAPDARRRAFDPFFTQKESGTGLGLAVVDRIIKAHDGLVRIESEEGQATRVSAWLPAEG